MTGVMGDFQSKYSELYSEKFQSTQQKEKNSGKKKSYDLTSRCTVRSV